MRTIEYPYFQPPFPTYNVAQKAVIPHLDKDVNIVVAFATAVGKCVSRYARVCLADGTYVPIGDLYDKGCRQIRVLSVSDDLKISEADATLVRLSGKETRIVELRTGERLDVTGEHPFLVKREEGIGWVEAEDLEVFGGMVLHSTDQI